MANIIKNIEKRKQLQQIVYDNYGQLTAEEKKDLDMEVGAAYQGYQQCLADICQVIADGREDGETLAAVVEFITRQYNGRSKKDPFRISEVIPTDIQVLIRENMKKQLIGSGLMKQGMEEEEADAVCEIFISTPSMRQSIIERYYIQGFNICANCGEVFTHVPMTHVNQNEKVSRFCSQGCLLEYINNEVL
jgi:hypothetical protein